MKNLNLNQLGVQELSQQELLNVEGGNIFKKAWDGMVKGLQTAHDWVLETLGIEITLGRYE